MTRARTVVKVLEHRIDDKGNFLNKEEEIVNQNDAEIVEVMYYLLHWGLTYTILTDQNQNYPVSYTVGICQHLRDGIIKSFTPDLLTVVGKEAQ